MLGRRPLGIPRYAHSTKGNQSLETAAFVATPSTSENCRSASVSSGRRCHDGPSPFHRVVLWSLRPSLRGPWSAPSSIAGCCLACPDAPRSPRGMMMHKCKHTAGRHQCSDEWPIPRKQLHCRTRIGSCVPRGLSRRLTASGRRSGGRAGAACRVTQGSRWSRIRRRSAGPPSDGSRSLQCEGELVLPWPAKRETSRP